jgi:LEA14-like dessication related protein
MIQRDYALRRLRCLLILMCASFALSACSSGKVQGESPFVQVSSWSLNGKELTVELRLRNVNDEALSISAVSLQVTAEDNVPLLQTTQNLSVSIPAGGFETLRLRALGTEPGLALLESLAREERASLAYRFEGTIDSSGDGRLEFRHAGHIYRVPGRPGEFR